MSSFFSVNITGQLESGMFPNSESLYSKITLVCGADWVVVSGIEEGITQISMANYTSSNVYQESIWNFPIDCVYKSTNVYGWPQLIVSVYGTDFLGRDVVKGYGCMRIPLKSGRFSKRISMIRPMATSPLNEFLSWITGRLPEFIDSKFVSKGDGREGNNTSLR